MNLRKKRKAQGILEYTLLLAAIIAVIISVLFGTGGLKTKLASVYNKTTGAMNSTSANATAGVFGM